MADMNWRVHAACRGVDPELFFPDSPDDGGHADALEPWMAAQLAAQVAAAKAVCRACPVRTRCLAVALESIPHGIAGGLTAGERRRARAVRGLATGRPPRWQVLLEAGSSTAEVAGECGVSTRTVERWMAPQRKHQGEVHSTSGVGGGSR